MKLITIIYINIFVIRASLIPSTMDIHKKYITLYIHIPINKRKYYLYCPRLSMIVLMLYMLYIFLAWLRVFMKCKW
jgi:hypothetical protein